MKSKKNKRSQMEIMGLAVVVILIIIGFLIMVRVMIQKKPSALKEEYSSSELATRVIDTMLETTATTTGSCKGMSFSELLVKCEEDSGFKCDTPLVCTFIYGKMTEVLGKTLNEFKVNYYLVVAKDLDDRTAQLNDNFKISNPGGECKASRESQTFSLSTSTGSIHIILDICTD